MLRNVLRSVVLLTAAACFNLHAQAPSHPAGNADRILVVKSTHTMTLYAGAWELKVYNVWLGRGAGRAKQQQGDNETPKHLAFVPQS